MEPGDNLSRRASELLEDARRFQSAAAQPGSHTAVPAALASLEEVLHVLSAAWYQLAADASPGIVEGRPGNGAARRAAARAQDGGRRVDEFPRFQRHDRPGQRVA